MFILVLFLGQSDASILTTTKYDIKSTKEYHIVCPLVGIGTLPTPLSPANVPLSPEPGGGHIRLRVRGCGSPDNDDWRKSLALCLLYPSYCQLSTSTLCLKIRICILNYLASWSDLLASECLKWNRFWPVRRSCSLYKSTIPSTKYLITHINKSAFLSANGVHIFIIMIKKISGAFTYKCEFGMNWVHSHIWVGKVFLQFMTKCKNV